MIKNTASQKIGAQLVSATDGSNFTGTVTVYVTVDAGTQTIGSVGSGICTSEGKGLHTYAPSQAETNGDHLAFTFEGTGAVTATVQVYTIAGDAFTRLGAPAGASVSADLVVIDNFVDDLETRLSAVRAGYLDNLSAGAAALEATAQSVLTDTAEIGTAGAGLTNIDLPNQTMNITGNLTGNVSGSVGSVTAGVTLAAAAVQAIWDALTSALTTASSIGKLIVDSLNATISSRASQTTLDTLDNLVDTEVADIKTVVDAILVDTAEIGAAGAGLTVIATQASVNTIDDFLDLEVAAIKAKTDQLTFTGATRVDANVAAVNNSITGVDKLSAHLPAVLKLIVGIGSTTTSIVLDATTGIDGAAPSATDDFYNGRVLVFTSGALAGQATSISDYVGATKTLTVVALTGGPVAAVTGVIV